MGRTLRNDSKANQDLTPQRVCVCVSVAYMCMCKWGTGVDD